MDGFELISRQAVIDTLLDWAEHSITAEEEWHLRQVIGDIRSMPGERKQGKWIPTQNPDWKAYWHEKCSVCGWWNTKDAKPGRGKQPRDFKYCPNCGAEMEIE